MLIIFLNRVFPVFIHLSFIILLLLNSTTPSLSQNCGGQPINDVCAITPTAQYICVDGNFFASQLINSQLLLNSVAAQTTLQRIIVKGKVTFDVDYIFAQGTEIIFLDQNSGFDILSNKTLIINGSHLHGCTKLWRGLEARVNSSLFLANTTIEDAIIGVRLRNTSKFSSVGGKFKKNVISVAASNSSPTITSQINVFIPSPGFYSNIFDGLHQLIEPIAIGPGITDPGLNTDFPALTTSFPIAGVWLDKVLSMTIGASKFPNGAYNYNVFQNFGLIPQNNAYYYGIKSISSNLTVRRTRFQNIGVINDVDPVSYAIGVWNQQNLSVGTVVVGNVPEEWGFVPTTFTNCSRDLHSVGSSVAVESIKSFNSFRSIDVRAQNHLQPAITCVVRNSKIEKFGYRGIVVNNSPLPIITTISDCEISDTDGPGIININKSRNAIRLETTGTSFSSVAGSLVDNNKIYCRSGSGVNAFRGIALDGVEGATLYKNEIYDQSTIGNVGFLKGIVTDEAVNAHNSRIFSNTIVGNSSLFTSVTAGIHLEESVECAINCNNVTNTPFGTYFFGMCNNLALSKNQYGNHHRGLYMAQNSLISNQVNQENRWPLGASVIDAEAFDLTTASSSRFYINSNDQSSQYWANPRLINGQPDVFQWFYESVGQAPSNNFSCLSPRLLGLERYARSTKSKEIDNTESVEPALTMSDFEILDGLFPPIAGSNAIKWELLFKLSLKIFANPDLMGEVKIQRFVKENESADFYQMAGLFFAATKGVYMSSTFLDLQSSLGVMNALRTKRFELNEKLVETENPESVLIEIANTDKQLASQQTEVDVLLSYCNELVGSVYSNSKGQLAEISTFSEHAGLMKIFLGAFFESFGVWEKVNEENRREVLDIAGRCRMELGLAVLFSRSFSPEAHLITDETCDAETAERGTLTKPSLILNPIPAHDFVKIEHSFTHCFITLLDLNGKAVLSQKSDESVINIDVSTLRPGFYQIRVQDTVFGEVISGKLVKI